MRFFYQSLSILAACAVTLVITSTELSNYITPLLGLVIIFSLIYIVVKQRGKSGELLKGSSIEVFAVSLALLLIIFSTGGINSNLYFLVYFLLFGIVFIFDPRTVFILLIGVIILFLPNLSDGETFSNVIKLGSLVLLAPVAYFLGRELGRGRKLERNIKDKTGQIIEDAETLRNHTQNEDAIDEIEDIAEKASELRRQTEKE